MAKAEQLSIVSVTHDLVKRRSVALITWDGVSDRRLAVDVPFDTKLEDLLPAVQAALVELRTELEIAQLKSRRPKLDHGDELREIEPNGHGERPLEHDVAQTSNPRWRPRAVRERFPCAGQALEVTRRAALGEFEAGACDQFRHDARYPDFAGRRLRHDARGRMDRCGARAGTKPAWDVRTMN